MVYILTDPDYAKSVWCKNFLKSLIEQLRRNRITFCEVFDIIPENAETVFMIAANYKWTEATIRALNSVNISPILICNHLEQLVGLEYSYVSSDIYASMNTLLKQLGQKNIALYGVNTNSLADIGKVDLLFSQRLNNNGKIKIYNNNGSLSECYSSFIKNCENFDAVICTNDLAAVSLIRNLQSDSPKTLNKLKIYSFAKSELSSFYDDVITTINIDYSQYGKAAIFVYKKIKKHKFVSNMSVRVKWNIEDNIISYKQAVALPSIPSSDGFYEDAELTEMMSVENLLNKIDDIDAIIIRGLMDGISFEEICSNCYLTTSAVKYRIKNILSNCSVPDKASLVKLLQEYNINL